MTDQYAVIGNPIAHSLSPQIHAWFAQATQQQLTYSTLCPAPEAFTATVKQFFEQNGKGLNVTLPFKQDAYALCNQTTAGAQAGLAVNTLWMENGKLCGDSTDGPGLIQDLTQRQRLHLQDARILLLGAGGTSASILPSLLAAKPAAIHIVNRTVSSAEILAQRYAENTTIAITASDFIFPLQPFDLCINTTSLSLQSLVPELSETQWAKCQAYYDCAYGPKVSPVLAALTAYGIKVVVDGLGMLVEQAALSFARWRGVMPETQGIYAQLRKQLP